MGLQNLSRCILHIHIPQKPLLLYRLFLLTYSFKTFFINFNKTTKIKESQPPSPLLFLEEFKKSQWIKVVNSVS